MNMNMHFKENKNRKDVKEILFYVSISVIVVKSVSGFPFRPQNKHQEPGSLK